MKSSISIFLLIFFTDLCRVYASPDFRICAFNLHNFGESKSKKSSVMHTLTRVGPPAEGPSEASRLVSETSASSHLCSQIIARCDVTLLQEVRDRKERALPQLMDLLNR